MTQKRFTQLTILTIALFITGAVLNILYAIWVFVNDGNATDGWHSMGIAVLALVAAELLHYRMWCEKVRNRKFKK